LWNSSSKSLKGVSPTFRWLPVTLKAASNHENCSKSGLWMFTEKNQPVKQRKAGTEIGVGF
jgi:hypothetical protein